MHLFLQNFPPDITETDYQELATEVMPFFDEILSAHFTDKYHQFLSQLNPKLFSPLDFDLRKVFDYIQHSQLL